MKHVCVCPEGGGGLRVERCSARICLCFIFLFSETCCLGGDGSNLNIKVNRHSRKIYFSVLRWFQLFFRGKHFFEVPSRLAQTK